LPALAGFCLQLPYSVTELLPTGCLLYFRAFSCELRVRYSQTDLACQRKLSR
jgi:hypothetical protein